MFGLQSPPKVFNTVTDAIFREWINDIYHYLDDFATLDPPKSEECAWNLCTPQLVCKKLGITLAAVKQAGPSITIEILGITTDTIHQKLYLPDNKVEHLQSLPKSGKTESPALDKN